MKKIIKVSSILGIATIVRIITGLLRAKFLAWQIGPEGVGLVGQALMYSLLTIQICTLNMPMGIIKNISESMKQKGKDSVKTVIDTAGTLQVMAALLLIICVLPFSVPLTKFLFSDTKYVGYFIGITLVTPFALYMVGMADPIFYGLKRIAEYTRLMILYYVFGIILVFL